MAPTIPDLLRKAQQAAANQQAQQQAAKDTAAQVRAAAGKPGG